MAKVSITGGPNRRWPFVLTSKLHKKIHDIRNEAAYSDKLAYEQEDDHYGKDLRDTLKNRIGNGILDEEDDASTSDLRGTLKSRLGKGKLDKLKDGPILLTGSTTLDLRGTLENRKKKKGIGKESWWETLSGDYWDMGRHDLPIYSTKLLRAQVKPSIAFKGNNYGTILGYASKTIVEVEKLPLLTSPANKAWRAVVATRRLGGNSKFSAKTTGQDRYNKQADADNQHIVITGLEKKDRKVNSALSKAQKDSKWIKLQSKKMDMADSGTEPNPRESKVASESISIQNRVYIINWFANPVIYLELQHRPPEIEVKPTSNWVSVRSMGRNNPFYMYTSGDDSVTFEIVWFMDREDRKDVITKCRLLESWSKANGYLQSPPTLSIKWGESDLFQNDTFILESAPYVLKNFQSGRRPTPSFKMGKSLASAESNIVSLNSDPNGADLVVPNIYRDASFEDALKDRSQYIDYKLYPGYAVQQLTFKRVTAYNRTYPEIVDQYLVDQVTKKGSSDIVDSPITTTSSEFDMNPDVNIA